MSDDDLPEGVASVLRRALESSSPVTHGPNFDELLALIDEELRAQIAMGRLGDVDAAAPGIHVVAELVADLVDRVYRLERRYRPGVE